MTSIQSLVRKTTGDTNSSHERTKMKFSLAAVASSVVLSSAFAFTPGNKPSSTTKVFSTVEEDLVIKDAVEAGTFVRGPIIVDKPTGTSFLPEETVERCAAGNPTEKVKLANDPVHAWVDIYEYARKIREGEMTWDEMEKADIDTVSSSKEEGMRRYPRLH